jgi:exodeoxyribonuclease VII large subunit
MELFGSREERQVLSFDIQPLRFTVKEFTQKIKQILDFGLPYVWIEGEVANLSHSQNGNLYFSLVEEEATIKALIFKTDKRSALGDFELKNGQKVLAFGKVNFYPRSGEVHFIVKKVELLGIGRLIAKKEALLKKYRDLFAREKKPIPTFPRVVGLVTSLFGAAIEDFLKVARESYGAKVLVYPVKIQGEGAEKEILQAVKDINEHFPEVEVIVIARGGGSFEDLAPFYSEELILGLSQSYIPIISAVGHEIDVTLCDLIADKRCSTPTSAAKELFPEKDRILQHLDLLRRKLKKSVDIHLTAYERELAKTKVELIKRSPQHNLQKLETHIEALKSALRLTLMQRLNSLEKKAEELKRRLWVNSPQTRLKLLEERVRSLRLLLLSLSPLKPLERGYALIKSYPEGKVVRKAKEVSTEDRLEILFADGKIVVQVLSVDTNSEGSNE